MHNEKPVPRRLRLLAGTSPCLRVCPLITDNTFVRSWAPSFGHGFSTGGSSTTAKDYNGNIRCVVPRASRRKLRAWLHPRSAPAARWPHLCIPADRRGCERADCDNVQKPATTNLLPTTTTGRRGRDKLDTIRPHVRPEHRSPRSSRSSSTSSILLQTILDIHMPWIHG